MTLSPFNPGSAADRMLPVLDRTISTPADERERAFVDLSPYRDGVITLGKFSGASAWERHPKGDEIVQVVAGEVVLRIEHDMIKLQAGDTIVIPADSWHQIYAAEIASILYVTPRPTIHFDGNPMECPLDPLAGPGEWLLSAIVRVWFWLCRE